MAVGVVAVLIGEFTFGVASTVNVTQRYVQPPVVYAFSMNIPKHSNWEKPYVDAMTKAGLIPESLKNDASYAEILSREEFAELITVYYSKIVGNVSIQQKPSPFTDTNNTMITTANELGLVGGVGKGQFKPYDSTNREQIAVMATRAEQKVDKALAISSNIDKFKGKGQVANWAKEGVGTMTKANVIAGMGDGIFKPKSSATKEQAIKIVAELAEKHGLIKIDRPVTPPTSNIDWKKSTDALPKANDEFSIVIRNNIAKRTPETVDVGSMNFMIDLGNGKKVEGITFKPTGAVSGTSKIYEVKTKQSGGYIGINITGVSKDGRYYGGQLVDGDTYRISVGTGNAQITHIIIETQMTKKAIIVPVSY